MSITFKKRNKFLLIKALFDFFRCGQPLFFMGIKLCIICGIVLNFY